MTKDAADCKDTERLIERLRKRNKKCLKCGDESCNFCQERTDAADALEAMQRELDQAYGDIASIRDDKNQRIAELERGWESIESEEVAEMSARIAELEGDLEVMRLQRDAKRWTRENHDE